VDWATFLVQREEDRAEALSAGRALASGHSAEAADLLRTWRFGGDAALTDRLLARLISTPPLPPQHRLAAALAPAAALPRPADPALPVRPWLRRKWLDGRVTAPVPDDLPHRLAWALDTLRFLGAEVERRQRAPWSRLRFPVDPARDAEVRRLWSCWLSGDPWSARDSWEALFLTDAARAFAAVMRIRRIPPERRAVVLEDLRDSFFFMMLGEAGATPGWQELAVRALETTGPAPITALCGLLDGERWRSAARCAVRRGYGPRSAALLFPETDNPDLQARRLAGQGLEVVGQLDCALDLHLACRQLDRWAEDPDTTAPDRCWQVVIQNRGRARARLRALLSSSPPETLQPTLLALPGLYQRTRFAIRRYCRDWAWIQLSQQFPFSIHTLDASCTAPPAGPTLTDPDRATLRTWILLAILKDRLDHLRRWIRSGGTGDRDASWGRLLLTLPVHLRTHGDSGRASRGQHHLRAELAELLPETLEQWSPLLQRLSTLPRDRSLGSAVTAALQPQWHPAIPLPKVRWRAYCDHAGTALRTIREEGP
jgi:hypothetical protein